MAELPEDGTVLKFSGEWVGGVDRGALLPRLPNIAESVESFTVRGAAEEAMIPGNLIRVEMQGTISTRPIESVERVSDGTKVTLVPWSPD